MSTILLALLAFQIKHYIFDFVLQTHYQFSNKGSYGHPGGILHAGLHALGSIPALLILATPAGLLAGIVIGEFVVHYHVDWSKEQIVRHFDLVEPKPAYWYAFGADQLAHQLTYIAMVAIVVG